MDSPVMNSIANVAGRGVGVLAALDTIKSGGLGSYLMNRQRLIGDPGFRASLAGSPFAAGLFGVSGDTGPAPAAPGALPAVGGTAQPSDFVGPPAPGQQVAAPTVAGYLPGTPRAWQPNLPPYDPEEALKQQALASQQVAIGAADPLTSGIAKMQVGIMPTDTETRAVLGRAGDIQHQAGVGSTVGVKLPGMTVQIGSPYNIAPLGEEEFPTPEQARAAATAHGPGWTIGPTIHGGWRPLPPPTKEQMLPPPPGGQSNLPAPSTGPVIRGTVKPPPLSSGAYQPNAFIQGMMQRGWTPDEAAAAAGNVHIESEFIPGNVAPGGDSGLIQWAGPRLAGLQSYATATGRSWQDPQAQMDWLAMERTGESTKYGGTDERSGFEKAFAGGGTPQEMAARFGQYVERPRDLSATVGQRMAAAELHAAAPAATPPAGRGVAYAAEVPPGAQPYTPPPPPTFDRETVVPHVVVPESQGTVGYPSPAPSEGAAPPPPPRLPPIVVRPPAPPPPPASTALPPPAPVWPGTPHDPSTGYPLQSRTQEYQGGRTETYREPTQGDFEQQLIARYLGINDPSLILNPGTIVNYFNWKQALDDQGKIHAADIARIYAPTSESERNAVTRLDQINSTVQHIVQTYTPEQIDYYVGMLKYPAHIVQQMLGAPWADQFAQFRTDIAPIAPNTFEVDAKNNTLSGTELSYLSPLALNPRDDASQFKANLQGLSDNVQRAIAFRSYIRTLRPDQLSDPTVLQQFNTDFDRQLNQRRLDLLQGSAGGAPPAPAPAAPSPPAQAAPPSPPPAPPPAWAPTSTWVVQ